MNNENGTLENKTKTKTRVKLNKIKNNKILELIKIAGMAILFGILIVIGVRYITEDGGKKAFASVHINEWNLKGTVKANGDMKVEEKWIVKYKDVSTLYREFDKIEEGNVKNVSVFKIDEKGNKVFLEKGPVKEKQDLNKFHFGQVNNGIYEIGWGVQKSSVEQEAIFVMSYDLNGAVKKYNDVGELYYKIIGINNKAQIDNLSVLIDFEEGNLAKENAKIWGHGQLSADIYFTGDGKVLAKSNGEVKTFFEVRVLFPKEYVSKMAEIEEKVFEKIVAVEEGISKEAHINSRKEHVKKPDGVIISIIVIVVILVFISFFEMIKDIIEMIKISRNMPEKYKDMLSYSEIPEEIGMSISKLDIFMHIGGAQIFQSVTMKLIHLKAIKIKRDFYENASDEELIYILDYKKFNELRLAGKLEDLDIVIFTIFNDASDSNIKINTESNISEEQSDLTTVDTIEVSAKDVEQYIEKRKIFNKYLKEIDKISEKTFKKLTNEGYFITKKHKIYPFVVFAVIPISFLLEPYLYIYPIYTILKTIFIWGGVLVMAKMNMSRETVKGKIVKSKLKALEEYLGDVTFISEHKEEGIVVFEEFLIYASAFGLTKKIMKLVREEGIEMKESNLTIPLLQSHMDSLETNIDANPRARSTGSGGGFSSGGGGDSGGGFGGGGGGGR